MGMRSIECYTRESFIEQGSYGMVFKARCKYSNKVYAIKQIKMEDSSSPFPITALREANILLSLKHPNVVQVREMLYGSTPDKFFMAMEMADRDLSKCIKVDTTYYHYENRYHYPLLLLLLVTLTSPPQQRRH